MINRITLASVLLIALVVGYYQSSSSTFFFGVEAGQQVGVAKKLDDLVFRGKSKKQFETVVAESPAMFRSFTRKGMSKEILAKAGKTGGVVTSRDIVDAMKKTIPKKFHETALNNMKKIGPIK
mmetsp:Transcript_10108/g.14826  ORF Transcript_10108/g.14826 Transcript_10108/m.14826 type:complete len:123 (-) Transcript_10108:36-404(-)